MPCFAQHLCQRGAILLPLSHLSSNSLLHNFSNFRPLCQAQEIILTDEAPIVAPILYSGQVNFKISFFCIQCFKLCMGNLKCPRCKLPICDKNCAKLKTHIEDCPVLRDVFDDEDDPKGIESVEERFQHLGK